MRLQSTSKINSQDLLLADEDFLRDFFENSPIGFHVFGPDKIIQAMNKAELEMLGYDYAEIIGRRKWLDLIIPEQRQQFDRHWRNILSTGRVTDLRYTLRKKSGDKIDVILNASARFDQSKRLINTRGTVLDISQFSRAYEALETSANSLREQKEILEKHNQALNALLANIEIEKQNLKSSITANLEQLILPALRKLKRRGNNLDQRNVDLLEKNFRALTSSFGSRLANPQWKLTPREIEICNMIQGGFATRSIADTLCVSERTVENHRNHIRKKLGLTQESVNLISYLKSL